MLPENLQTYTAKDHSKVCSLADVVNIFKTPCGIWNLLKVLKEENIKIYCNEKNPGTIAGDLVNNPLIVAMNDLPNDQIVILENQESIKSCGDNYISHIEDETIIKKLDSANFYIEVFDYAKFLNLEEGFSKLNGWINTDELRLYVRQNWDSLKAAAFMCGLDTFHIIDKSASIARYDYSKFIASTSFPLRNTLNRYYSHFLNKTNNEEKSPYFFINEMLEARFPIYHPTLVWASEKFKLDTATDNNLINKYPVLAKYCEISDNDKKAEDANLNNQNADIEDKIPRGALAMLYVMIKKYAKDNAALISENGNPNLSEIHKKLSDLILKTDGTPYRGLSERSFQLRFKNAKKAYEEITKNNL